MVKQKIALNNKYIRLYETQIRGLNLQKEALDMDLQSCKNRIKALEMVNRLEAIQLQEFNPELQDDINNITKDTNKLNEDDYKNRQSISDELNVVAKKVYDVMMETEKLKSEIPFTGHGENYKVTINIPTDKCNAFK